MPGIVGASKHPDRPDRVRFIRTALSTTLTPFEVARAFRHDPWPFALIGTWAGGGAVIGSAPLRVAHADDDPFEVLNQLPTVEGPVDGTVGGGWVGERPFTAGADSLLGCVAASRAPDTTRVHLMSERDSRHPDTIDEVIDRLDEIIQWAAVERSRIGYFAALYKGVTIKVREGIGSGLFEDGPRMERLDVVFANRYLEAVHTYRAGNNPTRSWLFALESTKGTRPVVLQHLLLGINAHINLDLGVAAAEVSRGSELNDLQRDFRTINDILSSRVSVVQAQIARVSPLIPLLRRIDPTADRAAINFSIERARAQAWTVAELLACLPPSTWPSRIDVLDRTTTSLARLIRNPPGWIFNTGLGLIRIFESHNIRHIIQVLQDIATDDA